MTLAKKIKILGEMHGGVCIAVVCHKCHPKSEENICESVLKLPRYLMCLWDIHPLLGKQKKNKEKILNVDG
jgi:hypothetical protein